MSIHGRLHERGMHLVGLVLLVSAGLEQEAHHLQMALVAGQGEGGFLELVRVGINPGAVAQKDLKRCCFIITGARTTCLASVWILN